MVRHQLHGRCPCGDFLISIQSDPIRLARPPVGDQLEPPRSEATRGSGLPPLLRRGDGLGRPPFLSMSSASIWPAPWLQACLSATQPEGHSTAAGSCSGCFGETEKRRWGADATTDPSGLDEGSDSPSSVSIGSTGWQPSGQVHTRPSVQDQLPLVTGASRNTSCVVVATAGSRKVGHEASSNRPTFSHWKPVAVWRDGTTSTKRHGP